MIARDAAPEAEAGGQFLTTNGRSNKIIDIRRDREEISLRKDISSGLRPRDGGEKRLPTLLLYDEAGLKLFEDITYLDEYYLTNTEIRLLECQADSIARQIVSGQMIVELGSGNLRKVDLLLKAIDKAGKSVEYYALDLSLPELQRTLSAFPGDTYKHVKCYGLHGTYDDGLVWLQQDPPARQRQKTILWLGSSIGNFPRHEAAEFLKSFSSKLEATDSFLIAFDGCKDAAVVFDAYNDSKGVTHDFYRNGLKHANRCLGEAAFDLDVWQPIGEFDEVAGRHHAFVAPTIDTVIDGVLIRKGERVRIEESYKYSDDEIRSLWQGANLAESACWTSVQGKTNGGHSYSIHMVSKRSYAFGVAPVDYAPGPIPTWDDWKQLWQLWDTVTLEMIPNEGLLEKPIKLRNACIFYLGHIPTFFDMKLSDVTGESNTDPKYYTEIFERGIDPDVDNPEHCHAHSEIPSDWPPLHDILDFQRRVRDRVKRLYDSRDAEDPRVARALWLGYEHEAMHLETLLYMLVQSDKTRPPIGLPSPDFEALSLQAAKQASPNSWFSVPESKVQVGLEDPETASGPTRFFGWDVEKPPQTVTVPAFEAAARPITVGEYASYLENTHNTSIPASWTLTLGGKATNGHSSNGDSAAHDHSNGHVHDQTPSLTSPAVPSAQYMADKAVRTVYGPVPLKHCLDWPACASYNELAGCAAWFGGRIPNVEEARSIYAYVDRLRKEASLTTQKIIPAVNSHLSNNGVQESPPCRPAQPKGEGSQQGPDPNEFFVDLGDANVGFQRWHPAPVTSHGQRLGGQAEMGGLWEWTSSPLRKIPGWEAMPLYPAYSADFYDDKHNIVLGGSWATVPRIAGRKSFVNWYQRNYLYVWAGARIVRDAR